LGPYPSRHGFTRLQNRPYISNGRRGEERLEDFAEDELLDDYRNRNGKD